MTVNKRLLPFIVLAQSLSLTTDQCDIKVPGIEKEQNNANSSVGDVKPVINESLPEMVGEPAPSTNIETIFEVPALRVVADQMICYSYCLYKLNKWVQRDLKSPHLRAMKRFLQRKKKDYKAEQQVLLDFCNHVEIQASKMLCDCYDEIDARKDKTDSGCFDRANRDLSLLATAVHVFGAFKTKLEDCIKTGKIQNESSHMANKRAFDIMVLWLNHCCDAAFNESIHKVWLSRISPNLRCNDYINNPSKVIEFNAKKTLEDSADVKPQRLFRKGENKLGLRVMRDGFLRDHARRANLVSLREYLDWRRQPQPATVWRNGVFLLMGEDVFENYKDDVFQRIIENVSLNSDQLQYSEKMEKDDVFPKAITSTKLYNTVLKLFDGDERLCKWILYLCIRGHFDKNRFYNLLRNILPFHAKSEFDKNKIMNEWKKTVKGYWTRVFSPPPIEA